MQSMPISRGSSDGTLSRLCTGRRVKTALSGRREDWHDSPNVRKLGAKETTGDERIEELGEIHVWFAARRAE